MKKWIALTLMLLMTAGLLAACGGNKEPEDKTVDLSTVYASMEEKQGWDENYMVDIEGEMLEYNYPGLSEISPKQFIAKMPMISSVVSEIVLMECETEEDAAKAAEILQARIDFQVSGVQRGLEQGLRPAERAVCCHDRRLGQPVRSGGYFQSGVPIRRRISS